MKKIERFYNHQISCYTRGDCSVNGKDLDALEQERDKAVEMVRAYLRYPNYKKKLIETNKVIRFLENAYGQPWEEMREGRE